MKSITTLVLLICTVFSSKAQLGSIDVIDRFEETKSIGGSVRIGNYIFTGGESLDNLYYRPTVICADTNGAVIWNSALLGLFPYSNQSIRSLHASSDGFLYGVCSNTSSGNIVFKLNPVNGSLIWSTPVLGLLTLKDYGQNIACLSNDNSAYLKILDGSTGAQLSNHFLRNSYLQNFEVDENLNVYYASYDTIIKRNHLNLNQALWKVKYNAQNIYEIKRIFYDTISGKLIGFGNTNLGQFKILLIDTLAGSVTNSLLPTGLDDLLVEAIKVKDDDVYFATGTGSSSEDGFRLVKMKISTGTITWMFYENLIGNEDNNGIIDFELDAQNNVYCYGYFNSTYNDFGSNLAMMKVNPTGTLNYIKQYSFNTTFDNYSDPSRCFLINNHLYLTAHMQGKNLSDKGNNNQLIKVDLLTGDSIFVSPMGGRTHNNSSDVRLIAPHPDGGFVACARKGQLLNVQRFDNNNSLVWDVNYYKGEQFAYNPTDIAIAPNGQMVIGLYTSAVNSSNNLAISGTSNDLMIMMLDANGNRMADPSFYGLVTMSATAKVVDVYHDGTDFLALLNDYTGVNRQYKISMAGNGSYPTPNFVQFVYSDKQKRYYGGYNASNYMILGNHGSGTPAGIRIYSKVDMQLQNVIYCPSYATVVHTFKEVGNSLLLVGGVGAQNYEFLLLMNKFTGAVVWEKPTITNTNNISVVDIELDPTGTYAYVLSRNNSSSVVRKYSLSNGNQLNVHHKVSAGYSYYANDFALNTATNQIAVGVSKVNSASNFEAYYYILNTSLVQIDSASLGTAAYPQTPSINAVHFNPFNGLVLGGIKPNIGFAKGFIDFVTCVETGVMNVTACNNYLCPINNVNYTTSGTYSIFDQTNSMCDSLYTLNLTITTQPSTATDVQIACDSLVWGVNGQTYSVSGQYIDTIQNALGCDSIITLELTIIPSLPLTIENAFVMPSDANTCVGEMAVTVSGNADFELNIDNGFQQVSSNGYSLVTDLCAGIHDLKVTDNCGDTLSVSFVIPVDSNYVFTNPFMDSLAQDSLGVTLSNCDIYYGGIDTAYIDSIWANGNTVNVIWNIVDSNGSNFDTTSYVLNNGTGVYWLQLSVFCPNKSLGEYFTVTEAIYFNNGDIETANLAEKEELLFKLHPNPTSDYLILSWNGNYEASVEIIDVTGALIRSYEVSSGESICVADLSNSMYYIKWIGNGKSSVSRFVKK